MLFASGMCAATTTFLALLPEGSHLVVTSDCYRRTRQFIREYLGRMGVETTVIEPSDTQKLAETIRDNTALFFTESPTNPYLRVIDVEEAVRVAHARGVRVVIDTTFASPINHRPLEQGVEREVRESGRDGGERLGLGGGRLIEPFHACALDHSLKHLVVGIHVRSVIQTSMKDCVPSR